MTDILVIILFILSGGASGWLGVDLLPVDNLRQVSNIEGFRIVSVSYTHLTLPTIE